MNTITQFKLSLLILISFLSSNILASDTAKEKRWADQIVDTILVGEPQWIPIEKHKYLAIYTEPSQEKAAGAVIIMHGIGIHPNWDTIVRPLRSELPESGWHTLSIQMPILENEAEFKDYIPLFPGVAPRINAAVAFLKEKGINNIILLGHSLGATMGAYYMASSPDKSIVSFVSIGASAGNEDKVDYLNSLKKIRKPVFELFGSEDLKAVVSTQAAKAKVASEAGLTGYSQMKVNGADHFFMGKDQELIKAVNDWIAQFANK